MTYTKDDLLNSKREKGVDHIPHVSHSGGPHPGIYSDKPTLVDVHQHGQHVVAGQTDQTNVHADLGKAPKPKRAYTDQVPVHSAAERQTAQGVALGGDHSSALDAMSGAYVPMKDGSRATPAMPKGFANAGGSAVKSHTKPVETSFGMRSRVMWDKPGPDDVGAAHKRHQDNRDAIKAMHDELGRRVLEQAGVGK